MRNMRWLSTGMLASSLLLACGTQKLDEASMYADPLFQLKLVRYYENLPFHYTGEVFRVQCASAKTRQSPAHKTQDAGWVSLGNGGAIGSKSASELVERERPHYLVMDDQTMVWIGNGISVSFDACGTFQGWYPTVLSEELIVPIEKPEYCQPRGSTDCRDLEFLGERAPRFEHIHVNPNGQVSFMMHSKAIRDGRTIRVTSSDFGKTWKVDVL